MKVYQQELVNQPGRPISALAHVYGNHSKTSRG